MRTYTTLSHLIFLVIFLYVSSTCGFIERVAAHNKTIRCIEREGQALLDFKKSLVNGVGAVSWGSDPTECCNWWGVRCNKNTGHVTVLDLGTYQLRLIFREVSPSLLELKHLEKLDLSFNDFRRSPIPEFFGSFKSLRVLNLMNANFSGTIPPHLGNLSSLHVLYIGGHDPFLSGHLKIKNLEWLSLLSSLRRINLYGVLIDLTSSVHVSLPPFLEVLNLSSCGLLGTFPFSLNFSSPSYLSTVDLSQNNLNSSSVFHLLHNASKETIRNIDLSDNLFEGPIPADTFREMKFLESVNLGWNFFTNGIPKSLGNLTHLTFLSLELNEFNQTIAELLEKLSEGAGGKSLHTLRLSRNRLIGAVPDIISTKFPSLRVLDLSQNQLSGSFAPNFGLPSTLDSLCLSNNQITGQFPDLTHLPSLRVLSFYGNRFQGGLPETIGNLSNLQELRAASNSMEGVVTEAHFSNLAYLQVLDLSYNVGLSFNFSEGWVPPFQLSHLYVANCTVGPQFPKWLQTQTSTITDVDLSSSGISDTVPNWFWNITTYEASGLLNLSNNKISGTLPPTLLFAIIDLSYNNFSGPIRPLSFLKEPFMLHLSNNKFVGSVSFLCSFFSLTMSIDLSNNQLSGEIPDCGNNFSSLSILSLANNNLFGKIPHSLGSLSRLQSLNLRNNDFSGELPSSLQNCTSLRVVDFGGNKLSGRLPSWIGGLTNLVIVGLRHNKFYGSMPSCFCHLNSIQILDLSANKLNGKIPRCFNNFTYLMQDSRGILDGFKWELVIGDIWYDFYTDNILFQWKNKEWEYYWKQLRLQKIIDLSSNRLIGDIPEEFSALKGLLSLNLSRNHLVGKICQNIYQMENLESLDLSRNQLSGEIPIGLARLNFLAVLDLSNNFLSGKIPTSTQLQSFDDSSYAGNVGLCGEPLPKSPVGGPPNNDHQEGDDFLILDRGFYISMLLGFSLSFWGFVVTLVLKDSWRLAYYGFLNDVKDWVYVKMKIYLKRLQQKLKGT